ESDTGRRMGACDGNGVNFGLNRSHVKNDESHDFRPVPFIYDFGHETRSEGDVVQQTVITVHRPVGKMMPGSLYIDNPIDIAFSDFTNSDFQCFHGQSPRPFCARKRARADHCSTSLPALRSSMRDRDPLNESSNPADLRSMSDSDLTRHHNKSEEL